MSHMGLFRQVLGQKWSEARAQARAWIASQPDLSSIRNPKKPFIGLALGGGFARGTAHLGVLKCLEEHKIPIHAIAGTSAGAFIGSAYAGGVGIERLIECSKTIRFADLGRWTISRMGLATNERIEQFLSRCIPHTTFERLSIPMVVAATDLMLGEPVFFRKGDLVGPVRASCAFPGLFQPVKVNGRMLIDGAFSCPVPVAALVEMGATHIIAVHLGTGVLYPTMPKNMIQVVNQCFSVLQRRAAREWRKDAQYVIEPEVTCYEWDDFEQCSNLIAAGEAAARPIIAKLQADLEPRKIVVPLAVQEAASA
jgi:NTE family protein